MSVLSQLRSLITKKNRSKMATTLKNVVLIGASGDVGKIVLRAFLASSDFNVTVLSRDTSEATFPSNVVVKKSDFSEESLVAAFKGQDAVVSLVGATAFEDQKKFIDAALRAGIKRFIPSELSSNSINNAVVEMMPLFGQKKAIIEYLKSKESEGLTWTGIATSLMFDWGLTSGFLGYDLAAHTAAIWDEGDKKFTLTNEKELGESVPAVLKNPKETANKYLYIASVETSQKEILDVLEEETSSKWTVNHIKSDVEIGEAFKKLGAGDFSGGYTLVRATTYAPKPELHANYAKDEKLANDLLGLKPENVRQTIKRVLKA